MNRFAGQYMSTKSRTIGLSVLTSLQVLFLLLLALSYYAVDWTGKSVILKTVPVDPRDPFYGDYLSLAV